MITRLTEKVSKAQAFRVLVLAQALLKQLSLSLSHTHTHTHAHTLTLASSSYVHQALTGAIQKKWA
jgi:hypothetical protein